MIRVHVICEGRTEATFVREVLQPHFFAREIHLLPSLIGTSGHKGGFVTFNRVFRDVKNRLRQERQSYCTVFIDYYGIDSKFPGMESAKKVPTAARRYEIMNQALAKSIENELSGGSRRFVPHIQMHEFEALLFSDSRVFSREICRPDLTPKLEEIAAAFPTPEDIDDGIQTSPSHRILSVFPEYDKVTDGSLVALEIGLETIRSACPCFAKWVERLEGLGREA